MEMMILLFPVIVVVVFLRENGWSWTAIMLLWDMIISSLYWMIYCFDRKSEEKIVTRREKIVYWVMTALMLCLNVMIMQNENSLTFFWAVILPLFTSSLWFIIRVIKES